MHVNAWIFIFGVWRPSYCVRDRFFNSLEPKNIRRKCCQRGWQSQKGSVPAHLCLVGNLVHAKWSFFVAIGPVKLKEVYFSSNPQVYRWPDLKRSFPCYSSQICTVTKDLGRPHRKWFVLPKGIQFSFCNKTIYLDLPRITSFARLHLKHTRNLDPTFFLTGREETPMSTSQKPQKNWVFFSKVMDQNGAVIVGKYQQRDPEDTSIMGSESGATINRLFGWKQMLVWDGGWCRDGAQVHRGTLDTQSRPIQYLGWLVVRT